MSVNPENTPNKNEILHDDGRAVWERPVLRRLAVNKAENRDRVTNDGGTGEEHTS